MDDDKRKVGSLADRTAAGLMWTALGFAFARVFSLLSQFIIAYLMVPSDFGVVGLGLAIYQFFLILANPGIERFLTTQNEKIFAWIPLARRYLLVASAVSAILLVLCAPLFAKMFDAPKLAGLLPLYGVAVIVTNFGALYRAIHQTKLNFKIISFYDFISGFVLAAVTLGGVAAGLNIYAFPLGATVSSILALGYFLRVTRQETYAGSTKARFSDLIDNVKNRAVAEYSEFIRIYGGYFILGLVASTNEVGIYHFAFRIALQTAILVRMSVGNVFFSVFSQVAQDTERRRAMFLRTSRLLGLTMVPILFLQAVFAEPLIRLIFEEKWLGAVPVIQILSVAVGLRMLQESVGSFLHGCGAFRLDMKLRVGLTLLYLPLMAAGGLLGQDAVSISYAFLVFVVCHVLISNTVALKLAELGWVRITRIVFPVVPLVCLLYVPIVFAQHFWGLNVAGTIVAAIMGSLAYAIYIRFFCREEWNYLVELGLRPLQRLRQKIA